MKTLRKNIITFILILFSILLFSCEHDVDDVYDEYIEETAAESQKAYIVFRFYESNRTVKRTLSVPDNQPEDGLISGVSASLFSDISFNGTRSDGVTLTTVTAASFAQLSGRSIEVEAGNWTFELEAWLGKTATNPGEKYVATQTMTIVPGNNELTMSLVPDSASTATPTAQAAHPGSWQVQVNFPCNDDNLIDQVDVWLLTYTTFKNAGTNLSSATKEFEHTYVKGTDFTAAGNQTLTVGETSRACGNYIVYVRFLKNVVQQGGTTATATVVSTEVINTWGELLRINPGATASGTINLPSADNVYKITYELGDKEWVDWDSSSTENIQCFYTRNSGTSGVITLPTVSAFTLINLPYSLTDSSSPYQFLGWYDNENFEGEAKTDFSVNVAEDKTFYAKWHEPLFDVYISCDGDDANDGSAEHPVKNATAAYSKFDDLSATNSDGSIRNTIHILTDYTGTNKIATPWGDGTKNGMLVKFVGEKGGVANADVTLELDMHDCGYSGGPQTFIYIENGQKMKFSHINITSNNNYFTINGFGCLFVTRGTELILEDSSIKNYYARGCSALAINTEGDTNLPVGIIRLKNCEISGNRALDADTNPDTVWGCAVNVSSGILHIEGKVIIKDNAILKSGGNGSLESEAYNLYVGTYDGASLLFNPIVIDGPITNSEIWLKLAHEPKVFTSGYATHETAIPSTYFHSDTGLEVIQNSISNEAELSTDFVVYVNSSTSTPAGNDATGDGSSSKPYLTIEKAIQKITNINDTTIDATILITGEIPCNIIIDDDGSVGTKLVAKSLTIQGTGTATGGDWKTAAGTTVLNGDITDDGTGDDSIITMSAQVPLTLNNLTMKNGKSTSGGGALCYDGTKAVIIDSCLIYDNQAVDYGGALYFSNSSVSLSYTELYNNKITGTDSDYGQGGAVYLRGGNLTYGASVSFKTNFASRYGGAIAVVNNGQVTMTGGTIESNGAYYQGGGVYIGNTGSFTMAGAASLIKDNGALSYVSHSADTMQAGGGVAVAQGGSFIMNGGEISGNGASSGGGIWVRGTAVLNEGVISSNKKTSVVGSDFDVSAKTTTFLSTKMTTLLTNYYAEANVEIDIPGSFEMNGGTITQTPDMTKPGQNGAGVNIYASSSNHGDSAGNATFNMTGGSITGLNIGANAAVQVNIMVDGGKGFFNMSGGSITNNKYTTDYQSQQLGGAITLTKNGHFTMTGGEISGNHAKTYGGAVYLADNTCDITLGKTGSESTITIKDNTAGDANTLNNIYRYGTNLKINIAGPLSTESEIGINNGIIGQAFTNNFATYNSGVAPASIFNSDSGYIISTDTNGEAVLLGSSIGSSVYTPDSYVFTLTADRSTVTKGSAATVTVTPAVTRTESNGDITELYYNAADRKLYLDSAFTLPEGSDSTVTWSASLWCGVDVESESLEAGTGANASSFTIPALSFENTYTMNVTASFLGYPHNANIILQCQP